MITKLIKLLAAFLLFATAQPKLTDNGFAVYWEWGTMFKRLVFVKNAVIDFWPSELNKTVQELTEQGHSKEFINEYISMYYKQLREKNKDE